MTVTVDIQVASEEDDHPPPSIIEEWIVRTLTHIQHPALQTAELSIRIVDEAEITELNHRYRHNNNVTNVLSFPAELPDHIDLPLLGDIVVCSAVVESEALQQQKSSQSHWAHMIIHGLLHLTGYDHIEDNDAEVMEALEIAILATLNIPNPYLLTQQT